MGYEKDILDDIKAWLSIKKVNSHHKKRKKKKKKTLSIIISMKNHFFFSYAGNKRNEVGNILSYIESCNFNNIETIVEPICGTSALSYYISTKYPKKFNYVLNDFDENLITLYKLVSNDKKFKKFNKELNIKVKTIINKEAYDEIKKENNFCHGL